MGNKGKKMDWAAARRIQSAQDRKGPSGDGGFKSRAMSAAARNETGNKSGK